MRLCVVIRAQVASKLLTMHLTTGGGKCDVCDGTKFGCKLVKGAASE